VTRFLLDTNVVSELRKPKPHGGVLAWIAGLREDQVYISAVTVGELQRGIQQTRKQDTAKALEIESWLDQLEASYNVLPMDACCFRDFAALGAEFINPFKTR
jgi:predicted nucleic acid-binding protein